MAPIDRSKYLGDDEVYRLRTVCEARAITDLARGRVTGVIAWAVIDTALQTGLRVSELAALTHGDLDFKRGAMRVKRNKRRKAIRETIAMSQALADHLGKFIEWKKTVDQPTGARASLFRGQRGPMTSRGLQQTWKVAVKRAGMPPELSIHCARHTLAVHLLKKTGNLRMVQKQLGHTTPAVTANLYADVSFEDMKDGLNELYERR